MGPMHKLTQRLTFIFCVFSKQFEWFKAQRITQSEGFHTKKVIIPCHANWRGCMHDKAFTICHYHVNHVCKWMSVQLCVCDHEILRKIGQFTSSFLKQSMYYISSHSFFLLPSLGWTGDEKVRFYKVSICFKLTSVKISGWNRLPITII